MKLPIIACTFSLLAAAVWVLSDPSPSDAPEAEIILLDAEHDAEEAATLAFATSPKATSRTKRTDLSLTVAAAARHYVANTPVGFRADCSGFIEAILNRAGFSAYGSVADFYQRAKDLGALHYNPEPFVGDLVFFHNTYDRNRNGKQDDFYSHIAVVVDVEPDGTIVMAHHGSKRSFIRMNLQPDLIHLKKTDDGKRINSTIKHAYTPPFGWDLRLASENWFAFATLEDGQNWHLGEAPRESLNAP